MNFGLFILYCASGLIGLVIGLKLRKKWLIVIAASVTLLFGFFVLMTVLLISGIN